jgi:outer membrane protein assembly factor BamB
VLWLTGCSSWSSKDNTEQPAPLVEFTPTLTLKTLWTANVGSNIKHGRFKLAPVFHEGKVFAASPRGQVTALDFNDGKPVWRHQLDLTISGGPGIGENLVLVGSNKGEVVALSETDGSERWRVKVSSEVLAAPRVSEGVIVVRTVDGKLVGLDSQKQGERLWVYERTVPLLALRGTGTPVIVKGRIIAGFDNGKLAALDLHTGKLLWEATVAVSQGRTELERMVDIDADPIVVDNIIYVTSYQGRTVAIDLERGQLLWKHEVSSYAGLGVDIDNLYVSDTKSYLWALKRDSGASFWKQEKLQARNITAPVTIGNYVVVGDLEGYLHWMRRDDGQLVARYSIGHNSILVPPLAVENTLIACTTEGEIVALRGE